MPITTVRIINLVNDLYPINNSVHSSLNWRNILKFKMKANLPFKPAKMYIDDGEEQSDSHDSIDDEDCLDDIDEGFITKQEGSESNTEKVLDRKLRAFQENDTFVNLDIICDTQQIQLFKTLSTSQLTHQRPGNTVLRSIENFIKDQKTLEERRVSRQLCLQENFQASQKIPGKPKLNPKTQRLAVTKLNKENTNHSNVFSRLYQTTCKAQQQQNNEQSGTKNTQVIKQRAFQASERLFNQSKERKLPIVESAVFAQQQMMSNKKVNDKLIKERVKREFEGVISKMGIASVNSWHEFIIVMIEMRYVTQSSLLCGLIIIRYIKLTIYLYDGRRDKDLLSQIWDTLPQPPTFPSLLSLCQQIELDNTSHYNQLYANKQATPLLQKLSPQFHPFRPRLSHSTSKLAQRQRMRKLSESQTCMNETNLLLKPLESRLAQKDDQLDQECTFVPKILKSSVKMAAGPSGLERIALLSERGVRERSDKTSMDYEFEKQLSQCTFKPYLISSVRGRRNSGGNFQELSRNQMHSQSSVSFKKHLQQTYPDELIENPVDLSLKSFSFKPLIFLDINLAPGRQHERIAVYPGDTAKSVADEFQKKNADIVTAEMRQRLEIMLEQQISQFK